VWKTPGVTGLAALALATVVLGDDGWAALEPEGGRCSVEMPGPVALSRESVVAGGREVPRWVVAVRQGAARFELSWVDLPPGSRRERTPRETLLAMRQGTLTMSRMRLVPMGSGEVGGAPFERFRVEIPDSCVVVHQLVLSGERVYHLMVVAPPETFRRVGSVRFLDSFRLKPPGV
jgi:hypothetical protein